MKQELVKKIKEIINCETYLTKNEHGYFESEIYTDYREQLDEKTIKKLLSEKNPMESFIELICECYMDSEFSERDNIENIIRENISEDEFTDNEEEIRDWLLDNIYINYPFDHFLKQDVCVNIIVDSGDGDYDFSLNNFLNYYSNVEDTINDNSSILWLVKKQGYKKSDLNNLVRKEDFKNSEFLKSIYEECTNTTSSMNALVFLVKMELKKLLEYNENNKKGIKISKNSTCGLYDAWYGAGGLLDIKLEKDVYIHPKHIDSVKIDGARGYSISDIWGLCSSAWNGTATIC